MKLTSFLFAVFTTFSAVYGQQENTLLEKSFWQSQPSKSDVATLVESGNDPTEFNSYNFDPMVMALLSEAPIDVISYLLDQDGNTVDKLTHDGRIYAHWAAYKGNVNALQLFIKEGSSVTLLDDHGFTVATFAANAGQADPVMYDLLVSAGAQLQSEEDLEGANALLLLAPHIRTLQDLDYFIEKGLSLNSTNDEGYNAFDYAAKAGNLPIMKALIVEGIDFNSRRNDNGNAMIMASKGMRRAPNSVEVFQYLESIGVEPTATTDKGKNALHSLASTSSDPEVFVHFLSVGLTPDGQDELGNTPLMNAAARNSFEIVELLAKESNNINLTNNNGESALSKAVTGNSPDVVAFLIDLGADINVEDSNGNNLSFFLAESLNSGELARFEETMNVLSAAGFDFSKTQPNGNNLFHLAAQTGSMDLMNMAKEFNLDVDALNQAGLTPLHIAALKAQNDLLLKELVSMGANTELTTEFGESPYDLASENEILNNQDVDLSFLKN